MPTATKKPVKIRSVPIGNLKLHPNAALVPEMPADQFAEFLADVKLKGVQKPVETVPGTDTILDGRTRLRGGTEAGLKTLRVVDADLDGDSPIVYMLRRALLRRHLTAGQRATCRSRPETLPLSRSLVI